MFGAFASLAHSSSTSSRRGRTDSAGARRFSGRRSDARLIYAHLRF